MTDLSLEAAEVAKIAAKENKLQIEKLGSQLDRTAKTISNLRTVLGVLTAVVLGSFAAGVYVANLASEATKIVDRVGKVEAELIAATQAISKQDAQNAETRQLAAASFRSLVSETLPVGKPMASTEPETEGGGDQPTCTAGSFVIGLQLYKERSGKRTIWVQCGKLGGVALN